MVVIIVSEVIAISLVWRIWWSVDFLLMKIALSAIAFILVLGPVLAFWIGNVPNKAPVPLQNRGTRGHYYLRWRPVFEARNAIRRFRLWRAEADQESHDDPSHCAQPDG